MFRWTVFEEIAANGLDVLSKHTRRKFKGGKQYGGKAAIDTFTPPYSYLPATSIAVFVFHFWVKYYLGIFLCLERFRDDSFLSSCRKEI